MLEQLEDSVLGRWSRRNRAARSALQQMTSDTWIIQEQHFDALVERVQAQAEHLTAHQIRAQAGQAAAGRDVQVSVHDGIAIVSMQGLLLKTVPCAMNLFDVEATSMEAARTLLQELSIDPSIRGVLLDVHSPGGVGDGLAALGDLIFGLREQMPIHAFAQDLMASAAVWAGIQASRVSIGPTAQAGSVGAFTIIDDTSRLFDAAGIKRHVVKFGAAKGDRVDGVEIDKAQLDRAQAVIDSLGTAFVEALARGRGIEIGAAEALATGEIWIGQDAVEVGLVDAVESLEDAIAALRAEVDRRRNDSPAPEATRTDRARLRGGVVPVLRSVTPIALRNPAKEQPMNVKAILTALAEGKTLEPEQTAHLAKELGVEAPRPALDLSAVPGAARAELEARERKLEEQAKRIAALEEAQAKARYEKEAEGLKFVPNLSSEKIARLLRVADERLDDEDAKDLRAHFKSVNEATDKSELLRVVGSVQEVGDAEAKLEAATSKIQKEQPELTYEQARVKAMTTHPDLYVDIERQNELKNRALEG